MKKILVIENVAATRNLFLEGIEAKGFQSIGADNGLTGINLAQDALPDLIISEITIPKLDGYCVLRSLRQNPTTASIPLIFVTEIATRVNIRRAMDLGADDYSLPARRLPKKYYIAYKNVTKRISRSYLQILHSAGNAGRVMVF